MKIKRSIAALAIGGCIALGVSACGGSSESSVPQCDAHATSCRETSNGTWVPLIWWYFLLNSQNNAYAASGSSTRVETPAYKESVPTTKETPTEEGASKDELDQSDEATRDSEESDDPSDLPPEDNPSDDSSEDDPGADDSGGDDSFSEGGDD